MPGFEEKDQPFEPAPPVRAKLFTHGGSQAVRLPKAFRFEGSEVSVSRDGDRVVLEPVRTVGPQTEQDFRDMWARIDALRGDRMIPYPRRDEGYRALDPTGD